MQTSLAGVRRFVPHIGMRDFTLWQHRLAPLLFPLAAGWSLAMGLRRRAYASGLLPSCAPTAPCVAVGNIASGGGGKTPVAGWLLQWAASQHLTACLLSRGYGGRPPELPLRVTSETPWTHSGDEPLLLARQAPEAVVLADPNRCRAAARAKELCPPHGPDILVMDDGMQHLRLRRHLNLVLLRPKDLLQQWGRVLPLGAWREPTSALKAASAFCVKCPQNQIEELQPHILRRLESFGKPVFTFHLQAKGLRNPVSGQTLAPQEIQSYIFASAVADNEQAATSAAAFLGRPPMTRLDWPDHHVFTLNDLQAMETARRSHNAEIVVCTAKDGVKLKELAPDTLYQLDSELQWGRSLLTDLPFPAWWQNRWQDIASKSI